MPCSYDPTKTRLVVGAHRCPHCGAVIIAGMPHPPATDPDEIPYAPIDSTNFDQLRPSNEPARAEAIRRDSPLA